LSFAARVARRPTHVGALGEWNSLDVVCRSVPLWGMTESGNDDIKARMREALERKQANDRVVERDVHDRGRAEAHGPAGAKRVHRRKSG
jgi:hypothetical protein